MRVTIYADSLTDADRAMRAVIYEARKRPEGPGEHKRNGALWSNTEDNWHALVWGSPDHWRVDCRREVPAEAAA